MCGGQAASPATLYLAPLPAGYSIGTLSLAQTQRPVKPGCLWQGASSGSSSEDGSEPLPEALQQQLGLRTSGLQLESYQRDVQPGAAQREVPAEASEADSDSDASDSSSDGEHGRGRRDTAGVPEHDREQRKAHKRAVKEANRERRKTKMPKKVKKKATSKGKR